MDDYRAIERVAFGRCFLEDGIWGISTGEQRGRTAIAASCARAVARCRATQHVNSNFAIDITGDSATMRSNFIATHIAAADGALLVIGGIYRDRLQRSAGRWLFARRDLEPIWRCGDESQLTLK